MANWKWKKREPLSLFGLKVPNPIPGFTKKKSWAELHSFFNTIKGGSGAGKATVTSQIQEYRSWIYSAVGVIQRRVGEVDYKLFRSDTDEEVPRRARASKLIREILETPNPYMNFRFLKQFVQIQLDLTGMAFIRKENDSFGLPLKLWPMSASNFVKVELGDGYQNWIKGFTFNYGGKLMTIPSNELLYFHYPHPTDPRVPCSPIQAQAYAVDIDHYIEVYERDFFKNSARPDVIVQYPENVQIEEEDAKRFIEIWKNKFSGEGHYHEPSLLDKGARVDILTPKGEDLGLSMLAEWSKDKLLAAYGVPEGKLGMSKDVNRANYIGIDITFNSECIKPRLKLIDDVISIGICRHIDPRLEFRHNNPVPRDRELDIQEIKDKVQVPIWTINEARERDNLPAVPGGDKIQVPLNYMDIGSVMPQNPEPPPVDNAPEKEDKKEIIIKSYSKDWLDKKWWAFKAYTENWERIFITRFAPLWEAQQEEVLQNLERYVDKQNKLVNNAKRIKDSFTKRWDAFCGRYEGWTLESISNDLQLDNERLMKLIRVKDQGLMKLALEGLFKKESLKNIIILIEGYIKTKANMDEVLFDFKQQGEIFQREAYKLEGTLLVEKANEELTMLGLEGNFTLENPLAREWLGNKVREFSNQVLSTRADQLNSTLIAGFAEGEGIRKLSERVQAVYGDVIKGWQAQRIARTEVISASNKGSYLGAKDSGLVKEKEWLSTRDQRTRGADEKDEADHYSMDGQRVKFEEPFRDIRTGAAMMFPGDSEMGAGAEDIINCRCSFVNYTVSELEESE